jgi:signal transduction histidine kinase/ActR/RegA family two-component response regulator
MSQEQITPNESDRLEALLRNQRDRLMRQEFLADVSKTLSSSLDYATTLKQASQAAVPTFAEWCCVYLRQASGAIDMLAAHHANPEKRARMLDLYRRFGLPPDSAAARAMDTGISALVARANAGLSGVENDDVAVPASEPGVAQLLVVPLLLLGKPAGALLFGAPPDRPFTFDDLRVAEEFARRAADAIDNARLYERAERDRERQTLLAEAGRVLATSIDLEETIEAVGRTAIPNLATAIEVNIVGESGELRPTPWIFHADPRIEQMLREMRREYPNQDPNHPILEVFRTGRSSLSQVSSLVISIRDDEEQHRILESLAIKSTMIVALQARGRRLGVLAFGSSSRDYDADDLELLEELGRRAAIAIDNALLLAFAQRERERVEEANRVKDEFLAMVSHELRTPLNAMLGWTRMLRSSVLDPQRQVRALEIIERNANSQAQLVEDLLDISRIITGKLRLNVGAVDWVKTTQAAIDAIQPAADAKGVRIQTLLDPSAGSVMGDADRLQQVVWNLVSNAVKFTPRGGRVQVRLRRDTSHVELTVEDSGQGISPQFLPHVFDKFRQADSGTTRVQGGLGLGLSIVRHLVELHGGTVRASSDGEGLGAVFIVQLPMSALKPQAPPPAAAQVTGANGEPIGKGFGIDLDGVAVLVVDDEPDARDLLVSILENANAAVSVASSAKEALQLMSETRPDVLVSDIGMPIDDGYSLIKSVRALPASRGGRVPAVALTAYARMEDRTRALLSGFNMHVAKPIDPTELLVVIANLAGKLARAT